MTLAGKRKFYIVAGALVFAFIGLLLDKLTGGDFATIVAVSVAAFNIAHAAQDLGIK